MFKMIGYWTVVLCACVALNAQASDDQVGQAAADPQQVASIVAGMPAEDVPAFAGQVMQAVARMPVSPKLRLQQMTAVAVEFLKAVQPEGVSLLLAHLIMNVPFQMLPDWVSAFKPAVDERTVAITDDSFDELAGDVLKRIDTDESLSGEDKSIYATFAIVLLARGKTIESNEAFVGRAMTVLSADYRAQVAAAAPAALDGDFSLLLGPDAAKRMVVPKGGIMGQAPVPGMDALGQETRQPNLLVYDVNRPFPLPMGPEKPGVPAPRPPEPESKPVVPPPYKGQF